MSVNASAANRSQLDVWLSQQTNSLGVSNWTTSPVSIPQLFSEQVSRTPQAIALVVEGTARTYSELEQAANRLAHLLAAHSAGPGDVIALIFEPSAQAVIAMLAVLKIGATYLPIDPARPDAHLALRLNDIAPTAAITTTTQAARLAEQDLTVIDINDPVIDTSYPSHALPYPALRATA